MSGPSIFDPCVLRARLRRACQGQPADFLLTRTAADIVERLAIVKRDFASIADIGTPGSALTAALAAAYPQATVTHLPPIVPMFGVRGSFGSAAPVLAPLAAVCDTDRLPMKPGSLDLAVSALALQFANDLPGALAQIRVTLKPDGLFLGALVGGKTLTELRAVLTEAETAIAGGASPRVAPFADVRDLGGLLQRVGFALPVADSETVTVRYDSLFALMADLRAMGATNTLVARRRVPTRRALFQRAAELYAARFADADGRIRATFEIISISGWAPHASQQRPAKRGSGQISLADALGDKTRRTADEASS